MALDRDPFPYIFAVAEASLEILREETKGQRFLIRNMGMSQLSFIQMMSFLWDIGGKVLHILVEFSDLSLNLSRTAIIQQNILQESWRAEQFTLQLFGCALGFSQEKASIGFLLWKKIQAKLARR